jgi:hypothetical protein
LFSFDMPSHARICCAMSGYASIGDAKQSWAQQSEKQSMAKQSRA